MNYRLVITLSVDPMWRTFIDKTKIDNFFISNQCMTQSAITVISLLKYI